jgi:hypothetical protein
MSDVFPHFFMLDLPKLVEWEKVDWSKLDAVFCGLPHGTTQEIIAAVRQGQPEIKILDMSADFRLRDKDTIAQWYGHEHRALELQGEAVYGLTEFYREKIAAARLVACPGCYPTAVLLALVPLQEQADRCRRHRHRREVGRHRRRPRAEAEHAVQRGGRGAVALFGRHPPPRAGDRAGDRRRGRQRGDRELHAASDPDGARRTLHVLRQAQRRHAGRFAGGAREGLRQRALRACREEGRDAADPEWCVARTMCRSALSPIASRTGRS